MMEVSKTNLFTHKVTLVANAVTRIVVANKRRISLLLLNDSAIDAFIAERDNVATTGDLQGIPLKATIGTIITFTGVVGMDGKKRIYDGHIYAVSAGAATIEIAEESEID